MIACIDRIVIFDAIPDRSGGHRPLASTIIVVFIVSFDQSLLTECSRMAFPQNYRYLTKIGCELHSTDYPHVQDIKIFFRAFLSPDHHLIVLLLSNFLPRNAHDRYQISHVESLLTHTSFKYSERNTVANGLKKRTFPKEEWYPVCIKVKGKNCCKKLLCPHVAKKKCVGIV